MTVKKTIIEGKAEIVCETEHVFYNPVQQFNRDMSVAAIKTWAALDRRRPEKTKNALAPVEGRKYKILEALSASGLRSIRYAKEIDCLDHVVANDLSADAVESIRRNAAHNQVEGLVVPNMGDACDVMYSSRDHLKRFHVVDLDPYGTAAPFIDGAVQCVADGGLLCVTCTDLAVLCGKYPETAYVKYGGVSVKSEYCHEVALRLVLNTLQVSAARYKRTITPLMSCSIDFYLRVFVRVETSADKVRSAASNTSMVYQCVSCPTFHTNPLGRTSEGEKGQIKYHLGRTDKHSSKCPSCDSALHIGGPMWGSKIHDKEFVSEFLKHLKLPETRNAYGTYERMLGMTTLISEEIDAPFYWSLPACAKTMKTSVPALVQVLSALLNHGYKASLTHCLNNAVKTDAPHEFMWAIFRQVAKQAGVSLERFPEGHFARNIFCQTSETTINLEAHPDADPVSRKIRLVRFQQNKGQNWGPKARAKKRKIDVE